jgi:hypothetical protein
MTGDVWNGCLDGQLRIEILVARRPFSVPLHIHRVPGRGSRQIVW